MAAARERPVRYFFFRNTQKRPSLQLTCDSATLAREDLRKQKTDRMRTAGMSSYLMCNKNAINKILLRFFFIKDYIFDEEITPRF